MAANGYFRSIMSRSREELRVADVSARIFNKRASEKLRSPDDLDKYVRVTNPGVWVVLGACVALLAGLLAWGVFGAVSTSVHATGAIVDGSPICLLAAEDVAKVHEGDVANFGGEQVRVSKVASVPWSRAEAAELLGSDYLVSTLMPGDWAYQVQLEGDVGELNENVPITINITTERIAPISLLLAHNG